MSFSEFIGNSRTVVALRGMLASERVPHAMLFSGPRGVGKFTLARMFAQAANCERLSFNPLLLIAGIEPSDDPVLRVREDAYKISSKRRGGNACPFSGS